MNSIPVGLLLCSPQVLTNLHTPLSMCLRVAGHCKYSSITEWLIHCRRVIVCLHCRQLTQPPYFSRQTLKLMDLILDTCTCSCTRHLQIYITFFLFLFLFGFVFGICQYMIFSHCLLFHGFNVSGGIAKDRNEKNQNILCEQRLNKKQIEL